MQVTEIARCALPVAGAKDCTQQGFKGVSVTGYVRARSGCLDYRVVRPGGWRPQFWTRLRCCETKSSIRLRRARCSVTWIAHRTPLFAPPWDRRWSSGRLQF